MNVAVLALKPAVEGDIADKVVDEEAFPIPLEDQRPCGFIIQFIG